VSLIRTACAALVLGLAGAPTQAEMVTIPPAEAREGLRQALAHGRADHAWHLAQGLIRANPRDYAAQAGLAIAALRLGRTDEARAAAAAAQALARTQGQRYEAAMLMAQTAEAGGGLAGQTRAALWARRAIDLAPAEAHRAMARGEVQRLRAASPLQLRFEFAVAPSSNVNNGTRHTTVEFLGLPFEISAQNQALSGWTAQAGLSARYRLAQDTRSVTSLRFAALHRLARLSGESKATLEQWRLEQLALGNSVTPRKDYDSSSLELGLSHRRQIGQMVLDLGVSASHNWSSGRDFSDTLRLDLGLEAPRGQTGALFGGIALERQWRKDGARFDADIVSVHAGLSERLGNGDSLRFTLGARRSNSASVDIAHDALTARLGWHKAAPVAGVRISATLGAEHRRHAATMLTPTGRRDTRLDATVSLGFERLSRMGFAPTLDIHAARTISNNAFFDGRSLGMTLGFRSTF